LGPDFEYDIYITCHFNTDFSFCPSAQLILPFIVSVVHIPAAAQGGEVFNPLAPEFSLKF
jgi:hypothetical protein